MRHRGITKVIISAISLKKKNSGLIEINCRVLTAGALRGKNIKANSLDELKRMPPSAVTIVNSSRG